MIIKLPLENPSVKCYPNHANLLSVISSNHNYIEWFLNNYIQLFADKNDFKKSMLRVDFYTNNLWQSCPFVNYQKISRKLVENAYKNINHFIIDCLKDNNYIYFLVDIFFISAYSTSYNKNNSVHDIFIYGVDTEKECFFAADNFENGIYSHREITFEEMSNGYNHVKMFQLDDWLEGIHLITKEEKSSYFTLRHNYKFDINKLILELDDYLHSFKTPSRYFNPHEQWMLYASDLGFGLEVYQIIIHYLENTSKHADKRALFVLWEHKKIMMMRLSYLEEKKFVFLDFSSMYINVLEEAEKIKNLYLKFIIKKDTSILQRIIIKLEQMKKDENTILIKLLEHLREQIK